MNVKELFIYNETYPLPLDKYAEFKTRRDGCVNNPMCMNKLKYDAESFIADWGKKHGAKIENGEESSFVYLKEELNADNIKEKVQQKFEQKKDNTAMLVIIGALFILGVYSIIHKNTTVGAITILLAILLFMA